MKLTWFHMQGYRDLPADFEQRYESVWVTPPNDELCDPEMTGKYLRWNLAELELAAKLGYDGVGTNEHHQNGYGFPMPNLTAYHLAAVTEDVAIVLLGMTLPLYSPLRVAEEMGQIDCLSGGRLVAGWPMGSPMDVNHVNAVTPTADPVTLERGARPHRRCLDTTGSVRVERQVQQIPLRESLAQADPATPPADLAGGERFAGDMGAGRDQELHVQLPQLRRAQGGRCPDEGFLGDQ